MVPEARLPARPPAPARRLFLAGTAVFVVGCRVPATAPGNAAGSVLGLADPVSDGPMPAALRNADVILLGEVHDNATQHALRLRWLTDLAGDRPFALAMEQFDADRQPALDDARRAGVPAKALAQQAGFSFDGWNWSFYGPYVDLALQRRLPLLAANLSPAEAMRIARGGEHPLLAEVPAGWGVAEHEAMSREIRDGHCGMMPEARIGAMVAAQQARDARMAQVVAQAYRSQRMPVILLAGNGHVRKDLGVPRYLARMLPDARVVSIGLVEFDSEGTAAAGTPPASQPEVAYDLTVRTARQARADPCAGLRKTAWQGVSAPRRRAVSDGP